MKMGKRGWVLALLVWVFAGDLAPAHEWIEPYERDDFQQFLRDFSLQAQYGAKREYPLPWHKNLRDFRYLSTKDYLVVGSAI